MWKIYCQASFQGEGSLHPAWWCIPSLLLLLLLLSWDYDLSVPFEKISYLTNLTATKRVMLKFEKKYFDYEIKVIY